MQQRANGFEAGESNETTESRFELSTPVLRPGTTIDHFRVMRLIGRGGMGEVYLVRDTKLGRRAALKVINTEHLGSSEAIESFLFEAKTTARFNHPNIVTIHAVGEFEGRPYVALEYLEGQNLRERLLERKPSLQESLRIGLAIGHALEEAHRNGVLHLDLKPENVVIPSDGRVRVVDFGLAKTFRVGDEELPGTDAEVGTTGWGTPAYVAPEQWRYRPTSDATDVWALGVILFELCTHQVPYPQEPPLAKGRIICDPEPAPRADTDTDISPELADLIAACLEKDLRRRPSASEVAQRLENLLQRPKSADAREDSPFRGLLPFSSRDADVFFGREPEVAAFVERLRHQPILTVVGPSGAGKTSFVQAGVVARLHEQQRWTVVQLRPGNRPFFTLADRIRRAEPANGSNRSDELPDAQSRIHASREAEPRERHTDDVEQLALQLEKAPHHLAQALRSLADETQGKVLLLVEQLEELFTLVDDPGLRAGFMRTVCSAADDPLDPVRVILTVRDDFLGRLATGPKARDALSRVVVIESLDTDALTKILTEPVEAVGYRYEDPSIVREMTSAVSGRPGSLPLLQFTAQRLWELRDSEARLLLRSAYDEVGGVEGALARHANGILDGLSEQERAVARGLLLRLVTPERTRKIVAKTQALEGLGARAEQVLDRLTQSRLIAVTNPRHSESGPLLELIHESLIRTWDTLARWLDENREEHTFIEEVSAAAELWDKRGCVADELWKGDALRHAQRMVQRGTRELPALPKQFLVAARAREQRAVRRRRFTQAAVLSALLSIAIGAVIVALFVSEKEREAREQRDRAEQQRGEALYAAARAALEQGVVLEARARLRAALEIQDTPGARALWWRLQADPRRWTKELGSLVYAVDYAPDGRWVAAGCQGNAVYLIATDTHVARVLRGSGDQVYAVAFSPDANILASGNWSGRIDLWDVESGRRTTVLEGHPSAIRSVVFSPDGKRLASSGSNGMVKIWRLPSGELEHTAETRGRISSVAFDGTGERLALATDEGVEIWDRYGDGRHNILARSDNPVADAAFSPDDRIIAAAGNDGDVHLLDAATGKGIRQLAGHRAGVRGVSFSPDGSLLASASYDKTIRVWRVADGTEQRVLTGHEAGVEGVAFAPDGERLVSGGRDHAVRLWSLRRRDDRVPEPGHTAGVYRVAFSPDGARLASAGGDQTVRLWDVHTGNSVRTLEGHTAGVDSVAFSPDGSMLASGSVDLTVRLWDSQTGAERRILTGHTGRVSEVAFDPRGHRLATVARDDMLRIFDLETGAAEHVIEAHTGGVHGVDFSRDGRRLVSGGADGRVVLWDTAGWRMLAVFEKHSDGVHGVSFSPDGHHIASGGSDRMVWVWDSSRNRSEALGPHGGRVYWLSYDDTGERIGAPTSDGTATIWTMADRSRTVLRGHQGEVNGVAFSPDGALAATSGDDGTVRLWNAATGQAQWMAPVLLGNPPRLLSHQGWIDLDRNAPVAVEEKGWVEALQSRATKATTSSDHRYLCILGHGDEIELWDRMQDRRVVVRTMPRARQVVAFPLGCIVRDPQAVWLLSLDGVPRALPLDDPPTAISWSNDGVHVATGRKVVSFDAQGAALDTFDVGIGVTALERLEHEFLIAYEDGSVEVLAPEDDDAPRRAHSFEQVPASSPVRILPGPAQTVVVGYANGVVGLWSLVDGARLGTARLHGRVEHLLLENHRLYAATDLGRHLVWDLGPLYLEYCELLQQVWDDVPILWENARAQRREPSGQHRCAP